MATLNELRPGESARVVTLNGTPSLIQRLAELGLFEGETLTVVALAPLGDPIEVSALTQAFRATTDASIGKKARHKLSIAFTRPIRGRARGFRSKIRT